MTKHNRTPNRLFTNEGVARV
ncbi:Protein of unknown function [Propionibacterium freudenreichii]|nr:Protein of unknown function [Propionibacterium freudenreichii]